jgi:hypothetical protein
MSTLFVKVIDCFGLPASALLILWWSVICMCQAKLAIRSENTDNSVQFEQAYIQSKNALCESMVEHSRLTDERDIAWVRYK